MSAILRHGVGNGLSPLKNPSFSHSLTSHFEVRRVPILQDKEGCEKMWPVASTRILKTRNGVSGLPVACTDYPSVCLFLFPIEKKVNITIP